MADSWTRLALIDPDAARRAHSESLTRALGMRCRTLAAPPPGEDAGRARVRVVVQVGAPGRDEIAAARTAFPAARIVVRGPDSSQAAAVAAFRAGADDFIWLGTGDAALVELLGPHLGRADDREEEHGGLVGGSGAMRNVRAFLRRLAPTSVTTLIVGETGTGKDCAALMLHRLGSRAKGPLVALNCAAIPEALLEGELFGYERGAFSGALAAYPGKLKLADGGTLLLDEIGELSPAAQAKVLRAIETREAYRLGARTATSFDVRIVAATNRDLRVEMEAGRFREDLYYRIAVAQVRLPPLRDRREDIAPIARHLLGGLADAAGRGGVALDADAVAALEAQDWPGNVRELRNALEVALVSASGGRIRAADLPAAPYVRAPSPRDERSRLVRVLADAGGNKSLAAKALNCSRMTLYRRLARAGIETGEEAGVTLSPAASHPLSQRL